MSKKEHDKITGMNRRSKDQKEEDENPTNIGPGVTEEFEDA
ncbi:MAG TPA: hypothetical protein VGQ13_06835 [Nitrososphaera sp.]|nr:hypothetical protein [Nitrososphaera sp.]